MSLADYLAKNYLTADSSTTVKKTKKRKRTATHPSPSTGLIIADDDALGWTTNNGAGNDDTDDGPVTGMSLRPLTLPLSLPLDWPPRHDRCTTNTPTHSPVGHDPTASTTFRKTRTNNWTTIGAPPPSSTEQAAANALIASAAAETLALRAADDSAPAISTTTTTLESGAHAGLQTATAVTAQLLAHQAAERRRFETSASASDGGKAHETIYRDASGRIINVAMKRAEARRVAEEATARKEREERAQRGDVQVREAERRREEVREARFMDVGRGVDDVGLNEELRGRVRWEDPMAGLLGGDKGRGSGEAGDGGRRVYRGGFMPNRYGIRPGWRWDGVDRGNGFEKEYFAARNRRRNLKELDYAWQMDE